MLTIYAHACDNYREIVLCSTTTNTPRATCPSPVYTRDTLQYVVYIPWWSLVSKVGYCYSTLAGVPGSLVRWSQSSMLQLVWCSRRGGQMT